MPKYIYFVAMLFVTSLMSCTEKQAVFNLDVSKYNTETIKNALCFDLTSDENIVSGLIVNNSEYSPNRYTLVLPFQAKFTFNQSLLNTSYSTADYSIIDYSINTSSSGFSVISLAPQYGVDFESDRELYWVQSGLKRTFKYIHKPRQIVDGSIDTLEYVAISIPPSADVLEKRSINNRILQPTFEVNNSRFFSIDSLIVSSDSKLEVEYIVEAKESQKAIVDFLLKMLALVFIPVMQFIFYDKQVADEKREKVKRIFIYGGIGVQLVILVAISFFAFQDYKGGNGVPYFEIALVVVGFLIEAIVLWLKKGEKS